MPLSKWLPCDFEQCHPLLWSGGILVDHWSTISSLYQSKTPTWDYERSWWWYSSLQWAIKITHQKMLCGDCFSHYYVLETTLQNGRIFPFMLIIDFHIQLRNKSIPYLMPKSCYKPTKYNMKVNSGTDFHCCYGLLETPLKDERIFTVVVSRWLLHGTGKSKVIPRKIFVMFC